MSNYAKMNKKQLMEAIKAQGLEKFVKTGKVQELRTILADAESAKQRDVEYGSAEEQCSGTHADDRNIFAMRKALFTMHQSPICNSRAIKLDDAMLAGATETQYNAWVSTIDVMRDDAVEACRLIDSKNSTSEQIKASKTRVFLTWRSLLKVGLETQFHKNMFIRMEDVDRILGFAKKFVSTLKAGTQTASTSKTEFRRNIEAYIGCRCAANESLTDKDYEQMKEYYSALSSKKSALERLNGKTNPNGEHVKGIKEEIKELTASIASTKEIFKVLEESNPAYAVVKNMLAEKAVALKELEESKVTAEKSIKKSEETIKKLEDFVTDLEASLNGIEE